MIQSISNPFTFGWLLRLGAMALLAFLLNACAPKVEVRGNLPPPSKQAALEIGTTDINQTVKLLGTPSLVATFDSLTWYYVSSRREHYGFFAKDITHHLVLELSFDKDHLLKNIKHYTKDELKDIDYLPTETPTAGREFTFWEQIFGNLGAKPVNSSQ